MPDTRRRWLARWPAFGAAIGAPFGSGAAAAVTPPAAAERMPGDPPEHHVVYQHHRADADTTEHILNSVGALIGLYGDNVAIVVVAFGPGIHLLARRPGRPVPAALRERAASQAKTYGVRFVACGNTMKSLHWTAEDLVDFAQVEPVGAATLMALQEQGYAYIVW